jgi:superfamily I DNA/RNA helicase
LEIRYDKLRNVVTSWLEQALLSRSPERNLVYGLTDLAELCQLTLTDPSDEAALVRLINHHDAAVPEGVPGSLSAALTGILARSLEATKTSGHITFADMLWLPAKLGVTPTTYQWVLVDECQDLSAAQLELALSAVAPKGRLIFVGDRHQAIYGFAGADNASVDKILDRTGATRFPLSTCFRCPSTHLDLARELVPQIENRPDAPPGVVQYVTGSSFLDTVEAGDLVLCRTTAPLIQACWELIRAGKAAHVKGRDIGKGLVTFVDRALKASRRPFSEAHEALRVFGEREAAKLAKVDGADLKLSALWDKVDACAHLLSASRATTPAEFSGWVDSLFADGSKGVLLSTVHKAKGLEADRVWLLRPDLMPHPKAADGWQQDQELNLKYVALTRSKDFLGIVAPPRRDY